MSNLTYKSVITLGLVSLLHCAFSATQHRSYVRLVEQEFTGLPQDIVVQCLVSLLVTIAAIIALNASRLQEIHALSDLKDKTIDIMNNRPNFYMFNHRGRLLCK
ncbi:ER membrane protein complex subunit 5-like [Oppia nitens]|uniref:ER membrane protein complex subunit 5-like n=1 Tax=Oppia nitens TaxID=1686743 RepID=UPI0023DA9947|nr:ER membrane protein complex subunit 5-like [Oppia nitens]